MAKKKIKLSIPESSEDITMAQFQEVIKRVDEDRIDPIWLVSFFSGLSFPEVMALKQKDIDAIANGINKALQDQRRPLMQTWEYNDVTYKLHPKMEDMTFGEITDLEKYMGDPANYHRGMAVLYREQTKESKALDGLYDVVPYTGTGETGDIFLNMPVSYFFGARAFFLRIGKKLEKDFRQYSAKVGELKE